MDGLCPFSLWANGSLCQGNTCSIRTSKNIIFVDLFGFAGSSQGYMQVAVVGRWGDPNILIKFSTTELSYSPTPTYAPAIP